MSDHPYQGLPSHQLHPAGVADTHPAFFDPAADTKFFLRRDQRTVTIGSRLAQNLSKWLVERCHCFLSVEPVNAESGGRFSVKFGDIVAQARQLLTPAFGFQRSSSEARATLAGKFVDPLRPNATMPADDIAALFNAAYNIVCNEEGCDRA